ncbi:MAG: hypothetical protein ACJAZ2_001984 [Glaciecola sp.]|jgi:hypothetical protein
MNNLNVSLAFSSLLFCLFISYQSFGQCSNTAYVEAVRNGDFEAGYLTGADTAHDFTPGGDFDFRSDLRFAGEYDSTTSCNWAMGDQYAVARAESYTCSWTNIIDQSYWGVDYAPSTKFKDHTPGKNGKGFCLQADMYTKGLTDSTRRTAWEQKITVFPSETYYFSMWQANFGGGVQAVMQVTVLPILNGTIDQSAVEVLVDSAQVDSVMVWGQFKGQWTPSKTYNEVYLRIEYLKLDGGSTGLDVAIDDVSFKNGIDITNVNLAPISENRNACEAGAKFEINTQETSGSRYPIGNVPIYWFKGDTYIQNEITGFQNDSVVEFTETGNYRFCIDYGGNEHYNGTISVTDGVSISYADFNLCNNPNEVLKASAYDTSQVSGYQWTLNNGAVFIQDSFVVTSPDTIYVQVLNKGPFSCAAHDTVKVSSSFFTVTDSITYCPEDEILYVTGNEGRVLSIDSLGQQIIGIGDSIQFSGTEIPVGAEHLYLRAVSFLGKDTAALYDLTNSGSVWLGKNIQLKVNRRVVVESAKITTKVGTEGTYGIKFSGQVSTSKAVFLKPNSTQTIQLGQILEPGNYTITGDYWANMQVNTYGGQVTQNQYLNGAVEFQSGFWHEVFLQDIVFREVGEYCHAEKLPVTRKDYCENTLNLKDVNDRFNACIEDTFEVKLYDLQDSLYDLSNHSVNWFGPNDYVVSNTSLNGFRVSFKEEGTYRFKVTNPSSSKVFNGFVEVYSLYNTDFKDLTLCDADSNYVLRVNPHSNNVTIDWHDHLGNTYYADTLLLVQGGTYLSQATSGANLSCYDRDTIEVSDLLFSVQDTIYACGEDSLYTLSVGGSRIVFSEDSEGLKYLGDGPNYEYSTKSSFSTVYVKNAYAINFTSSFNYTGADTVKTYGSPNSMRLEFNEDVYLTSFKLKVNKNSSDTIEWGVDGIFFTDPVGNDSILEVQTNVLLEAGTHTFRTFDPVYSNVVNHISDTVQTLFDGLIVFPTVQNNFFMYDMTFSKIIQACPARSVYFETDSSKCLLTTIEELNVGQINVYPNPTRGSFMIQSGEPINKVSVYDQSGRVVQSNVTSGTDFSKIELYSAGVYFIRISTDKKEFMKKVVVVK